MKNETIACLKPITNVLLIIAASVTTLYLLMLGWYNTLTLDDYVWIDIENRGIFKWMYHIYMTWEGRWSAFTVDAFLWKIWAHAPNLILFTVLHLALGYITTYCLMKKLLSPKKKNWQLWTYAILMVNIGLLALQEISTLYWLCCPHYIMCVWAFIWLCYMLFLIDQYRWWHIVVIVLMSLYLGGLAETFTPLVIMVLGIKWLYNIIKCKRYNMFQQSQDRYLTISLLILVVGFLIMVLAPGNAKRIESMSQISLVSQFSLSVFCVKWCKATAILLLRFVSKSLYYAAILLISMYVGYIYKNDLEGRVPILNVKQMLYVLLGICVFLGISVAPCVYAMGWYAPLRSFSYMSFVFAFGAIWIGLSLGAKIERPKAAMTIASIVAICLSGLAGTWIIKEQPVVAGYYDWVMGCRADVQQKIDNQDTTPYYAKEYVFPAERNTYSRMCKLAGKNRIEYQYPYMRFQLTTDPKCWKNASFQEYMHADFDIYGCSEPTD